MLLLWRAPGRPGGDRPSGPAALCGCRLSNSIAIPTVVIEMGGIDGVR